MKQPEVKWEPISFEARVGRLTLTVSAPCLEWHVGGDAWHWQVWAHLHDLNGCRGSGRCATKEEAMAEAVRHLDPKAQRAWRKANQ